MDGLITEGVSSLFGLGFQGVILAASFYVNVMLFRRLEASQQARLEEQKASQQALNDNTQAINTMRAIIEHQGR